MVDVINKKMLLYKILKKYHKGKENAIVCKQLKRSVGRGVREKEIRRLVSLLRKDGIPICSCSFGYYYPESVSDVIEVVSRFNKYLTTLSDTGVELLCGALKI